MCCSLLCLSKFYFDDVLVHSKTLNHVNHLQSVFELLRRDKFYANTKKCTFAISKVGFLGYVICGD